MRTDELNQPCPETLGEYYDIYKTALGENLGKPVLDFLAHWIAKTPKGRDYIVPLQDHQVRAMLFSLLQVKG